MASLPCLPALQQQRACGRGKQWCLLAFVGESRDFGVPSSHLCLCLCTQKCHCVLENCFTATDTIEYLMYRQHWALYSSWYWTSYRKILGHLGCVWCCYCQIFLLHRLSVPCHDWRWNYMYRQSDIPIVVPLSTIKQLLACSASIGQCASFAHLSWWSKTHSHLNSQRFLASWQILLSSIFRARFLGPDNKMQTAASVAPGWQKLTCSMQGS